MKKLYNSPFESCFPSLKVKLTYTDEFKNEFNLRDHQVAMIGDEYANCITGYNKTTGRCDIWNEECGSKGIIIRSGNFRYCIFRKGTISIWKVVEGE